MLENTLPQLEQLIEKIIDKNNKLKAQVSELELQKAGLVDENETFQLEALENEEKQKQANLALTSLLEKLQSVEEVS
ncbi:MAG: cell division protein ZapB [Colwellia sp.]|jgi:cell division protein ZapB